MSSLPPVFREAEFVAVDTPDEDEIKRRFAGILRDLHAYLNGVPCLRDIQQVRRKWKRVAGDRDAFGNFATDPRHWYTFNHGGRTEAQFNIGLHATHLRVGLGFEFTMKKGGDPTVVGLVYSCFTHLVRTERDRFSSLVRDGGLEIEWVGKSNDSLQFVKTKEVVDWLLNPPDEPWWIFVGRLLRRGSDKHTLEDAGAMKAVIESVFGSFRPIWEKTQTLAR